MRTFSQPVRALRVVFFASTAVAGTCAWAQSSTPVFTAGNVVVLVEGCGVQGGTCSNVQNGSGNGTLNSSTGGYGDNQASPVTLFQFTPNAAASSASYVNSLQLPQTQTNANLPLASEYGSSSEGTLQLSGDGRYLTFAEYGINAAVYNAAPQATYGTSVNPPALAQSGSLTGQSYTPVARTVVLVDPYGNANSSSALYNIYNTQNPRSVFTQDGLSVYISGQATGNAGDATGGVFYSPLFQTNTAPTAITGLDSLNNTVSQDTRTVQIVNGTLYVSADSKQGSGNNRDFIGTLGTPPATSIYNSRNGPTQIAESNSAGVAVTGAGRISLTTPEFNTVNTSATLVNLSPSGYFFANAYTLYVADTGAPKNNSAGSSAPATYGDGGLQKWVNTNTSGTGTWQLMYTISPPNLVLNSSGSGVSGLYGLTGVVEGANVNLYATSSTLSDLDTTYLYGFQDVLASTTKPSGNLSILATAPSDSNFKGVAMAPSLPPGSATILSRPLGLNITISGTGCSAGTFPTPVTLVWTAGSTCQLTTSASQTSGSSTYNFNSWQDGTTGTTDTVTAPTSSSVYTATFADTTTTTVNTPSVTNGTVGDPVVFTANVVDSANLANSPVGFVTFTTTVGSSSYTLGTAGVNGGTASLTTTLPYAGSNKITASFAALNPANFSPSADNTGKTISVAPAALQPDGGYTLTYTQGDSGVLTLIVGYPGTVSPTGAITFQVDGSTNLLGTPTCVYKVKHFNCGYPFTANLQPYVTHTISFSQAGDANYTAASGSDKLLIRPAPQALGRPVAPVAVPATVSAMRFAPAPTLPLLPVSLMHTALPQAVVVQDTEAQTCDTTRQTACQP